MPLNDYKCEECGYVSTTFSSDDFVSCLKCGRKAVWHPSTGYGKKPFKSFTTTHVTGQPIEIDSITKLRRVEKEYGVNFPAYGDTMLSGNTGQKETHWTDEKGVTHRE